jgi:hypothetical protein
MEFHMDFHKIWEEQCEATRTIRERFGVENALDYLIGEKLLNFAKAADHGDCARRRCWPKYQPDDEKISPRAALPLDTVLCRREVPRGEVAQIVGTVVRAARPAVADSVKHNVIGSKSHYVFTLFSHLL